MMGIFTKPDMRGLLREACEAAVQRDRAIETGDGGNAVRAQEISPLIDSFSPPSYMYHVRKRVNVIDSGNVIDFLPKTFEATRISTVRLPVNIAVRHLCVVSPSEDSVVQNVKKTRGNYKSMYPAPQSCAISSPS